MEAGGHDTLFAELAKWHCIPGNNLMCTTIVSQSQRLAGYAELGKQPPNKA